MKPTFCSLLPFTFDQKERVFTTYPQRPFRPAGLCVWAPPGALIEPVLYNDTLQAVASFGRIPARFFGMGKNFAQICEQIKNGIEPSHWCDWETILPGRTVRIEVLLPEGVVLENRPRIDAHATIQRLGPEDGVELVMWGRSIR